MDLAAAEGGLPRCSTRWTDAARRSPMLAFPAMVLLELYARGKMITPRTGTVARRAGFSLVAATA